MSLGVEKVFWYTLMDVPRDSSTFCSYGLIFIPGKQCLNVSEDEGRKVSRDLKTKKAFEAYKTLTR